MAGYEEDNVFAEVVFNLPVEGPFHYNIPESLSDKIGIGSGVFVSFGSKILIGYVVGFVKEPQVKKTKDIEAVVRACPLVNKEMLRFTKWLSEYYFCSWGEAIAAAVPAAVVKIKDKKVQEFRGLGVKEFKNSQNSSNSITQELKNLPPCAISLTSQQKAALGEILQAMDRGMHKVFLLHGITGSGKTEVYLQAIGNALKDDKSSIVLVPEISLTPQTVGRFKERFGDEVAVLHSRLTNKEKRLQWERIELGSSRIVVGARSCLFAPVKRLGLLVVDEEHETTYKQDDVPRYHARDAGIKRASYLNAVVILGSATPSVETYYNALKGRYRLLTLTSRVEQRQLPEIKIVDMRDEILRQRKLPIFSILLKDKLRQVINERQQAILFLNRRGFATYASCSKCREVLKCSRCQAVLTYHFQTKRLLCHYCFKAVEPPEFCPQCKSSYIRYKGIGTEKVESEAYRLFPDGAIARMDADSTKKRDSYNIILGDFASGRLNLLVGTQMIAKGLDFPKVTLVGIISADTALNQPDFRAAERCFNLITQVAGRAGRGDTGGEVILQTYCPLHYAIVAASRHDYTAFYKNEIAIRKDLNLPPFSRFITIMLRGRNQNRIKDTAATLTNALRDSLSKEGLSQRRRGVELIGAVPAPMPRIKGQYRYIIIIKGKKTERIIKALKSVIKGRIYNGALVTVDIDSYKMI